ncbi:hypothetical protein NXS19_011657 [Fusarium pseudograminearum]|nr:hypothetical protein NXS19_011657 [Fusarium pseudograminearum]
MARKFFVGGNFKMNGSKSSIKEIVENLNNADLDKNAEVVVSPPALYLPSFARLSARKSRLPLRTSTTSPTVHLLVRSPSPSSRTARSTGPSSVTPSAEPSSASLTRSSPPRPSTPPRTASRSSGAAASPSRPVRLARPLSSSLPRSSLSSLRSPTGPTLSSPTSPSGPLALARLLPLSRPRRSTRPSVTSSAASATRLLTRPASFTEAVSTRRTAASSPSRPTLTVSSLAVLLSSLLSSTSSTLPSSKLINSKIKGFVPLRC